LNLPVIVVVGMRLGCLNHAMLTAQAIQATGLHIAGWIANDVQPDMLAPEGNLAYLKHQFSTRFNTPLLGHFAWQAAFSECSAEQLAPCLDVQLLGLNA